LVSQDNNAADIFLSYARENRPHVQMLAEALEHTGWSVLFDQLSTVVDQDIFQATENAVNQANCVIVIWSYAAIQSKWVLSEAEIAHKQEKLILIRLDDSKLPVEFEALQALDFANWKGEHSSVIFVRLKKAIERLIGLPRNDRKKAKSARIKQTEAPVKPPLVQKRTLQLPDIDWIEIPEGIFIYGKDYSGGYGNSSGVGYGKGYADALPLEIKRFFISRYPITHCQYQTFIDAGGYEDERWWQDLIKSQPTKASWQQPNRPRDNVNWYEAVAFCRWLSAQFGYVISLPTERQWEKAARGTDGREYPWGASFQTGDANVFLDSNPENLNQTCAVGLFPHRASPYQVMDMAGNVWEWCLNPFDQPNQIEPNTSNAPRVVLRGGCWDLKASEARTFMRRSRHPDLRDYEVGFRVVCRSPK